MPRLSISSWTLHRLLGSTWYHEENGSLTNRNDETPELVLTDVPRAAADHGIETLELCHFHFPNVNDDYLREVKLPWQRPVSICSAS